MAESLPRKGSTFLSKRLRERSRKDNGHQLVIAGPDNPDVESAFWSVRHPAWGSQPTMTWTGLLTDEQKWGAFYAADAFCLPSHQENFALGVTEALACGLPVLISNKVNIWREIDSAGAGFVGNDDVSGTTQCLERWLSLSTR